LGSCAGGSCYAPAGLGPGYPSGGGGAQLSSPYPFFPSPNSFFASLKTVKRSHEVRLSPLFSAAWSIISSCSGSNRSSTGAECRRWGALAMPRAYIHWIARIKSDPLDSWISIGYNVSKLRKRPCPPSLLPLLRLPSADPAPGESSGGGRTATRINGIAVERLTPIFRPVPSVSCACRSRRRPHAFISWWKVPLSAQPSG
jgi:hypothetical protein